MNCSRKGKCKGCQGVNICSKEIEYTNKFYEKYKPRQPAPCVGDIVDGRKVYSHSGEDVIMEKMLDILGIKKGWVCEFGAWDGKYLSNTFRFVKNGWDAIMIEAEPQKYKDLLKTAAAHPNITPLNKMVDYNNTENSLDNILKQTNIPIDFDILSIDIDSYDYHVWKSLELYRPKIVCIEINACVDPYNETHIHHPDRYWLTAFRPMYELGIKKGYTFVLQAFNLIFIKNELYDKLGNEFKYSDPLENFRMDWIKLKVSTGRR